MSGNDLRPDDLLHHAQADVVALLVILSRHRLTVLEQAVVRAIAGRYGSTPTSTSTSTSTPASTSPSEHLADDPRRIRRDDSAALIARD